MTCALDDRVEDVRPRVEGSPYGFALVTSPGGLVLGRLKMSYMETAASDATAESLMDPIPSTVRADLELPKLVERLDEKGLRTAIVTTPEGKLLGVVLKEWIGQR